MFLEAGVYVLSAFYHAPRVIYKPNVLASLSFMISLHVLGWYKWLLNTSQDDSIFITRWKTSFSMVLSRYLFSATV